MRENNESVKKTPGNVWYKSIGYRRNNTENAKENDCFIVCANVAPYAPGPFFKRYRSVVNINIFCHTLAREEEEADGWSGEPPEEVFSRGEERRDCRSEGVNGGYREYVKCEHEHKRRTEKCKNDCSEYADIEKVGNDHSAQNNIENKSKCGIETDLR